MMTRWTADDVQDVSLEEIGEHYARYRLPDEAAEQAMASSIRRYGQISPVVTCLRKRLKEWSSSKCTARSYT